MITIDGSLGEGGGQILRSSLSLSLVTGKPFHITHIRAGRKKPGLMRQHLTAIKAAQEICNAKVSGDVIGSQEIIFHPGKVKGGKYNFSVGTAGSATLVLQTILPPLLLTELPSSIEISGGTHNPFAPPFEFLERVFIPLVNKMGPKVSLKLERFGFYPAGGGKILAEISPTPQLKPIRLLERGALVSRKAKAFVASLPGNIAMREIRMVAEKLNWDETQTEWEAVTNSNGPGNVLLIELQYENISEISTGFGEVDVAAEKVAGKAIDEIRQYLKSGAPVGSYLADQLILPFALAGEGCFLTQPLTQHSKTNLQVMAHFLNTKIECVPLENRNVSLSFGANLYEMRAKK